MTVNRRQFIQYCTGLCAGLITRPGFTVNLRPQSTRKIPSSGQEIPAIGLGSWITFGIDPQETDVLLQRENVLREFLNRGGGLLDSSPMYGRSEEVIGLCLKNIGHSNGLIAATKVWTSGLRQGQMQMELSRVLWGIPAFDLMQVHNLLDWETHIPVLQSMKASGQIRYAGVTTSHGRRHDELISIMKTQPLDFVQFTYNVLDREAENYLLPLAADKGIAVIINRPFQRGGLFDYVANKRLPAWASEIECQSWAQFFLKFIISHPAVTCAIPATSRVDHLQENMGCAYGVLPDTAMRSKMAQYIESL